MKGPIHFCMKTDKMHHVWKMFIIREIYAVCQRRRDESIRRDIYFLISFLISFNFDVNTRHMDWYRDKSLCAHAQCGNAQ